MWLLKFNLIIPEGGEYRMRGNGHHYRILLPGKHYTSWLFSLTLTTGFCLAPAAASSCCGCGAEEIHLRLNNTSYANSSLMHSVLCQLLGLMSDRRQWPTPSKSNDTVCAGPQRWCSASLDLEGAELVTCARLQGGTDACIRDGIPANPQELLKQETKCK